MSRIESCQPVTPLASRRWVRPLLIGIAWATSIYVIHKSLSGRAKYIGFGAATVLTGAVVLRLLRSEASSTPEKKNTAEDTQTKQTKEPDTGSDTVEPAQTKQTKEPDTGSDTVKPAQTKPTKERRPSSQSVHGNKGKDPSLQVKTIQADQGDVVEQIEKLSISGLSEVIFLKQLSSQAATALARKLREECNFYNDRDRLVVEVSMSKEVLDEFGKTLKENKSGNQPNPKAKGLFFLYTLKEPKIPGQSGRTRVSIDTR